MTEPATTTTCEPWCEAEADHDNMCRTATRLRRLLAFAEDVRDEIECIGHEGDELGTVHVDECFHCYAIQALEPLP